MFFGPRQSRRMPRFELEQERQEGASVVFEQFGFCRPLGEMNRDGVRIGCEAPEFLIPEAVRRMWTQTRSARITCILSRSAPNDGVLDRRHRTEFRKAD